MTGSGKRVDRRLGRFAGRERAALCRLSRYSRIVRAIVLNAAASSPSSSRVRTGTTWSRSPRATPRALRVTARIGSRIDRLRSSAISAARATVPKIDTTISRIELSAPWLARALSSSMFLELRSSTSSALSLIV